MTDFQAEQFENTTWSSTKSTTPNFVIYRYHPVPVNLQNSAERSGRWSGFSNIQWLSCPLFTLIDHSSPQNLTTLRLIYQESRVRFLKEARSRTCQFSRSRWKKRDLERFSQALNGRFLCFAPKIVEHSHYLLPPA